ncbi:MAG: HD domain-containing protein [Gemmatimonadetes bacterium]|nr:HD domain-containing protein [Gemmatimonadota bacterium]
MNQRADHDRDGNEAETSRTSPSFSKMVSTGFALMSVVPILLSVYLMSRPSGVGGGVAVVIVGLMIASAIAGFFFIRRELSNVFLGILHSARNSAAGDLEERIRHASEDEIGKISETIRSITRKLEDQSTEAERAKDRLRGGLTRVAQAIQASRNSRGLLEYLVSGALESVDGRVAYVMEVDEEAGDFVTLTAVGEGAESLREKRIPLGEGIPGLAARERRPIQIDDLASQGIEWEGFLDEVPTSTIAAPLFHGEMLHGVLIVHDRNDAMSFTEDDVAVVSNLTALTSAALGQQATQARLEDALDAALHLFSQTVESRDPYARGHSARVARYCEKMAASLRLDLETTRMLRRAALLHDVGKIVVPEHVLRKEGRFNDEELEHVRTHSAHGEKLVRAVSHLQSLAPMIRHHHERSDGSGYPDGLSGDDIPLTTHILIVANAFDVMTSDRSYRKAMSLNDAFETLRAGAGRQFDRRAVHALLTLDPKVLKAAADSVGGGGAVKGQGTASISVRD